MDPRAIETIDARKNSQKLELIEMFQKIPILQVVLERVGTSRATYYRWRLEDKEFAAAVDKAIRDGRLLMNDLGESQLIALMKGGNLGAIKFWLNANHPSYRPKVTNESTEPPSQENKQIIYTWSKTKEVKQDATGS